MFAGAYLSQTQNRDVLRHRQTVLYKYRDGAATKRADNMTSEGAQASNAVQAQLTASQSVTQVVATNTSLLKDAVLSSDPSKAEEITRARGGYRAYRQASQSKSFQEDYLKHKRSVAANDNSGTPRISSSRTAAYQQRITADDDIVFNHVAINLNDT